MKSTHRRKFDTIVSLVDVERNRQDEKWGTGFKGRSDSFWLSILTEEIGEAAHAILERDEVNLTEELIQAAAVIVSWLEFRTPLWRQDAQETERGESLKQ